MTANAAKSADASQQTYARSVGCGCVMVAGGFTAMTEGNSEGRQHAARLAEIRARVENASWALSHRLIDGNGNGVGFTENYVEDITYLLALAARQDADRQHIERLERALGEVREQLWRYLGGRSARASAINTAFSAVQAALSGGGGASASEQEATDG